MGITENYLNISNLYKKLSEEFLKLSQMEVEEQMEQVNDIGEHQNLNLSEELFIKIVNVYLEETKRKHDLGLKRKSGVLLAKRSAEVYIEFFNSHLKEGYLASEYEENPTFIIIKNKIETPIAIIRFITDLGYQRGNEFGKRELTDISELATKLKIDKEKVFIVIVSMINSLSEPDVKKVLNDYTMTNKKLLDNPEELKKYVTEYIKSFSKIICNPKEHIFVWSYYLHPNVIADELYNNEKQLKDYNLNKIEDVITPILNKIVV